MEKEIKNATPYNLNDRQKAGVEKQIGKKFEDMTPREKTLGIILYCMEGDESYD